MNSPNKWGYRRMVYFNKGAIKNGAFIRAPLKRASVIIQNIAFL